MSSYETRYRCKSCGDYPKSDYYVIVDNDFTCPACGAQGVFNFNDEVGKWEVTGHKDRSFLFLKWKSPIKTWIPKSS